MKNRLVILSLGLIIAGCTANTQPAPYELRGSKFYGKNSYIDGDEDQNSSDSEEENSDFVYKGRSGDSNTGGSIEEEQEDFSEEDEESSRPRGYRFGSSTKPAEPEIVKSKKLAAPEHIDAYEDEYNSANVRVPSFNESPKSNYTNNNSGYLDLSPVEKNTAFKKTETANEPIKTDEPKSYAANLSDRLKNISPKEKPNFADEEDSQEVASIEKPKEKPKQEAEVAKPEPKKPENNNKLAAAQPKNKPTSLNGISPASGNDSVALSNPPQTTYLNIPQKPAATTVEEPVKDIAKKVEVTSIKEEIQTEAKKTDITSIPKIEQAPPAIHGNSKFIRPVDGKIIQEFGGTNDGIKIQAAEGTPVKAAAGGEVVYSGNQLQGYGNMIVIRHNNGYLTAYSHLEDLSLRKGAKVAQGEVIGKVGKSGNVSSPQLHFGVRKGRSAVNPRDYL